jgi:hypothetical protein
VWLHTQDRNYILGYGDITPEADGDPVPQIFWDAFQQRTGSGRGGLIFLLIPLGAWVHPVRSICLPVRLIVDCFA